MVCINPTITLNVNGLNISKKKKDRDCQNGSKNETQLYVLYKKPNLNIKTHTD